MKQTKRKHIGIIGGVGPQATLELAISYEAVAPRMINSMEVLAKEIVKSYYEQN